MICTQIPFVLLSFLMFPSFLLHYFPLLWRAFFRYSFWRRFAGDKLLVLLHRRMSLFHLHFWAVFLLAIEFWVGSSISILLLNWSSKIFLLWLLYFWVLKFPLHCSLYFFFVEIFYFIICFKSVCDCLLKYFLKSVYKSLCQIISTSVSSHH